MKNLLMILVVSLTVAGCARLGISDLATAAGATGGALVGTATGLGPAAVLTTTAGGAVAGGLLVEDGVTTAEACAKSPEVCNQLAFWDAVNNFWQWGLAAFVALMIAMWLIPGPQTFFRRKDNANSEHTRRRSRQGRSGS